MNLIQGPESKVSITLNFMDIEMRGLSKAIVYKASGFNEPSKLNFIDFRFKTPKLMIDGPYSAKGLIIILPLNGNGTSHMHLGMSKFPSFENYFIFFLFAPDNVHFLLRFKAKAINRNGSTFLQLEKSKMTFNTTR